ARPPRRTHPRLACLRNRQDPRPGRLGWGRQRVRPPGWWTRCEAKAWSACEPPQGGQNRRGPALSRDWAVENGRRDAALEAGRLDAEYRTWRRPFTRANRACSETTKDRRAYCSVIALLPLRRSTKSASPRTPESDSGDASGPPVDRPRRACV